MVPKVEYHLSVSIHVLVEQPCWCDVPGACEDEVHMHPDTAQWEAPSSSSARAWWHTQYIFFFFLCVCMQASVPGLNFPAPICCAQCETSHCAGARTAMHAAEIPLISLYFQRHSLCWPRERRLFAFTHQNQRFSCCLPLHFHHLTRCFSPAQLTQTLHYASNGREYIKIQGILYILCIFHYIYWYYVLKA